MSVCWLAVIWKDALHVLERALFLVSYIPELGPRCEERVPMPGLGELFVTHITPGPSQHVTLLVQPSYRQFLAPTVCHGL